MSNPEATYSFLPWLRQGIANTITGASGSRASIQVELEISGEAVSGSNLRPETITQNIQLFGPGDIVGIDRRTICKAEPQHWITNFEPNYLPYIEFYDEDFPWRYTPAAPNGDNQLRPWLALVVLKEGSDQSEPEYKDDTPQGDKPLPFITVENADQKMPNAEHLWAWAHVHINQDLIAAGENLVEPDTNKAASKIQAVLSQNPDKACSRIICSRKLEPNTGYHAFLIPSFESGRLAGLGRSPNAKNVEAMTSAWDNYEGKQEANSFPYYHRWYFRTGVIGDFEYLVRLLEPRLADPRVGVRDLDVSDPGANLPGITESEGILQLGGALRVPASSQEPQETEKLEHNEFQASLAKFINLADNYKEKTVVEANQESALKYVVQDPDPMITPPLYGQWHALTQRLLNSSNDVENTNWVHELNLDPRHRLTAGLGSQIVQEKQEDYMKAAWEQVGEIIEANRTIRAAQLAKEVSGVWYQKYLTAIALNDPDKFLTLTSPLHGRVMLGAETISHQIKNSKVSASTLALSLRALTKKRGHLSRKFTTNVGEQLPSVQNKWPDEDNSTATLTPSIASFLYALQELTLTSSGSDGEKEKVQRLLEVESFDRQTNDEKLVAIEDFTIIEKQINVNFQKVEDEPVVEARVNRFRKAVGQLSDIPKNKKTPKPRLDIGSVTQTLLKAVNPDNTIPERIRQRIKIPDRIRKNLTDDFQEAMVYPEFDMPMYKSLIDRSTELFLPNINLIGQNSITLLESNQEFIEAYMVGLNHELARELLWREYPTDQRGSYFRQFWDVSSAYTPASENPDIRKEKLKDIPPIHKWKKNSKLGDHDNRDGADAKQEVVIVIRGELLKKYPNAAIHAHRARWRENDPEKIQPRLLEEINESEQNNPPNTKIRVPIYQAKVEPDIYFLGFDLPVEEARGNDRDAGWFFIIKERPGELRFGLDISRATDEPPTSWDDLSWEDISTGTDSSHIDISSAAPDAFNSVQGPLEWNDSTNSAALAHILYQPPVQVAVHAAELLPLP